MDKEETIKRLQREAIQSLQVHLDSSAVEFIEADELMVITEEDAEDFLARESDGFFAPLKYAAEVFKNFEINEVYYFDKLVSIKP